jgi:hypothetical protein
MIEYVMMMLMIMIFNIIKCSMLKFVVILNVVFTILQK